MAISDLYSRGQKAYFKLINIFENASPKASTVIHTFDHTVKRYYYMLVKYGVFATKISLLVPQKGQLKMFSRIFK